MPQVNAQVWAEVVALCQIRQNVLLAQRFPFGTLPKSGASVMGLRIRRTFRKVTRGTRFIMASGASNPFDLSGPEWPPSPY